MVVNLLVQSLGTLGSIIPTPFYRFLGLPIVTQDVFKDLEKTHNITQISTSLRTRLGSVLLPCNCQPDIVLETPKVHI